MNEFLFFFSFQQFLSSTPNLVILVQANYKKYLEFSGLTNDFGRAVSRILSSFLRTERIICLSSQYPEPGEFLRRETSRFSVPYLALHPMGFSVPRRLLAGRWSLTPPFHPYRSLRHGGLIFCGTLRRNALFVSPTCIFSTRNAKCGINFSHSPLRVPR